MSDDEKAAQKFVENREMFLLGIDWETKDGKSIDEIPNWVKTEIRNAFLAGCSHNKEELLGDGKRDGVLGLYKENDEDSTVVFSFTSNLDYSLRKKVFEKKRLNVKFVEVK